jgi:hypothetical protein
MSMKNRFSCGTDGRATLPGMSDETVRHEQILWEDGTHYWFLRYCAGYTSLDAEVGAACIEYKD